MARFFDRVEEIVFLQKQPLILLKYKDLLWVNPMLLKIDSKKYDFCNFE